MQLGCTITTRRLRILKENKSYIQVAIDWSNSPLANPDLWMGHGGDCRVFDDADDWEPARFMVKDKGKRSLFSSLPVHLGNINGNAFPLVILTKFRNKENKFKKISEAPGFIQMLHLVGKDPWRRLLHPRFKRKRNHLERLNIGLSMKLSIDEFSKFKSQLNHKHNPRLLQHQIDSPHHTNLMDFIIGSFSKSMNTCEYSKPLENDVSNASLYGIKGFMRNTREPYQKMRVKIHFLPLAMPLDGPEAAEACNETQNYTTRRGIRQTVFPRGTTGEPFRSKTIWKDVYHLQTSKKMKSQLVKDFCGFQT